MRSNCVFSGFLKTAESFLGARMLLVGPCYDDARNKYVRRANKDRGRSSMVRGSGSRRVKAVVPRGRGYKRIDNQVELRSGDFSCAVFMYMRDESDRRLGVDVRVRSSGND